MTRWINDSPRPLACLFFIQIPKEFFSAFASVLFFSLLPYASRCHTSILALRRRFFSVPFKDTNTYIPLLVKGVCEHSRQTLSVPAWTGVSLSSALHFAFIFLVTSDVGIVPFPFVGDGLISWHCKRAQVTMRAHVASPPHSTACHGFVARLFTFALHGKTELSY